MALTTRNAGVLKRLAFATLLLSPGSALGDDIDLLPPTVIFVTSTGFWEDDGGATAPGATTGTEAAKSTRSGYYKLVAVRQPDRTAKIYLQQIAISGTAPEMISSIELDEFTAMKPYVSDIRPERPRSGAAQPGLFATVNLKTDPNAGEADSWTVMIDDLGELTVEKASN